jgi:cytoskeletal protein CcmA (bactofilin family)
MEVETQAPEGGKGRQRSGQTGGGSSIMLGPRDRLEGKVTVEGDIRVRGTVEGELNAAGDVQIDPSAKISALITGRNISIRGKVTGDVTASERLLLAGSGSVTGNVQVGRLAIEDGATLNGNVSMGSGHRHGGSDGEEQPPAES